MPATQRNRHSNAKHGPQSVVLPHTVIRDDQIRSGPAQANETSCLIEAASYVTQRGSQNCGVVLPCEEETAVGNSRVIHHTHYQVPVSIGCASVPAPQVRGVYPPYST